MGRRAGVPSPPATDHGGVGAGFLLDAVLRTAPAYRIPVDAFPLTGTVLWLVLLGGLLAFHNHHVTRHGLKLRTPTRRAERPRGRTKAPSPAVPHSRTADPLT